jgi:hypothetical protein
MVLPNAMAVRNVMETPVLDILATQEDLVVTLLTPNPAHRERISKLNSEHLYWADIRHPVFQVNGLNCTHQISKVCRLSHRLLMRLLRGRAEFANLVFRFNHFHQFAGHRHKVNLSPERRHHEATAGNFVDNELGKPFPNSWLLFRLFYRLYYSTWGGNPLVEAFFDQYKPDLVVLLHVQNQLIKPYSIAARLRRLPILGIVGSWDQPTTKGPTCPGICRYIVQSKIMQRELAQYHNVSEDRIEIIGWPQMDLYKKPGVIKSRDIFTSSIGVPQNRRLLVFAAYSARLGPHEPSIAQYLATKVRNNAYGEHCTLIIRPHPKDNQWEARFGALHAPPNVIAQRREWGRLDYLTNLLFHTDILIASCGSICLDAVALDTCVINVAFDGDLEVDYYESVRRWYETDHYAAVVRSNGTRVVESYEELDQAIITYLRNPGVDRTKRERLRHEQLEPFDGRASERMVKLIIRETCQNAQRLKQEG